MQKHEGIPSGTTESPYELKQDPFGVYILHLEDIDTQEWTSKCWPYFFRHQQHNPLLSCSLTRHSFLNSSTLYLSSYYQNRSTWPTSSWSFVGAVIVLACEPNSPQWTHVHVPTPPLCSHSKYQDTRFAAAGPENATLPYYRSTLPRKNMNLVVRKQG